MFDLGFIGFGNIAQALANGLSSSNYNICTHDNWCGGLSLVRTICFFASYRALNV